jgi:hypothetical protein
MKTLLILALTLAAACSSSNDLIDKQFFNCASGQDISVAAGLDSAVNTEDAFDDRFAILVEVSNNSHADVTVESIRVEQIASSSARYLFDRAYRTYDQVIEPGKDHLFELATNGRMAARSSDVRSAAPLGLDVFVTLSNGSRYRCGFSVQPSR